MHISLSYWIYYKFDGYVVSPKSFFHVHILLIPIKKSTRCPKLFTFNSRINMAIQSMYFFDIVTIGS